MVYAKDLKSFLSNSVLSFSWFIFWGLWCNWLAHHPCKMKVGVRVPHSPQNVLVISLKNNLVAKSGTILVPKYCGIEQR